MSPPFQGRRINQATNQREVGDKKKKQISSVNYSLTVHVEATYSSETSVDF
jgi:hypothetical protein